MRYVNLVDIRRLKVKSKIGYVEHHRYFDTAHNAVLTFDLYYNF